MTDRTTLTPDQTAFLLAPIHPSRIGRDGKGFAHVEAWDIRRTLLRVFGFGGFSTELQDMTLVRETEHKPDNPNNKSRWTVIYRATVVLTVKVDGQELARYHGVAMGDATNQPSLADAHDLAMKTADSQAFKRAAVNLGDQFGLSLYDDGSTDAVVNRSLGHPEPPAVTKRTSEQAAAVEPPQDKLAALAQGAVGSAQAATDLEMVRALYREASDKGLLGITVTVPGAGQMPLAHVLSFHGERLTPKAVAS
ncbi:Rad52/Rad22 family DNA repair protein [Streptomyces sp. NPDC048370]|uniref:Rad52/Rad22 family DNA repair protein n=1 Tax=Streptomyces sp. NPDC048370 TaxID=3365540 RepID=UPI00370FDFDB